MEVLQKARKDFLPFIHTGSSVIFLFPPSTLSSSPCIPQIRIDLFCHLILCLVPHAPFTSQSPVPLWSVLTLSPSHSQHYQALLFPEGRPSLLTTTTFAGRPVLSCSVQDFFKLPWKLALMLYCNRDRRQLDCLLFPIFFHFTMHFHEPVFCI